jgi:hypothetical protein
MVVRRCVCPDTEPEHYVKFLDDRLDLRFLKGTETRRRLWKLFDRHIVDSRTIDWFLLQKIGDVERAEALIGRTTQTRLDVCSIMVTGGPTRR